MIPMVATGFDNHNRVIISKTKTFRHFDNSIYRRKIVQTISICLSFEPGSEI